MPNASLLVWSDFVGGTGTLQGFEDESIGRMVLVASAVSNVSTSVDK